MQPVFNMNGENFKPVLNMTDEIKAMVLGFAKTAQDVSIDNFSFEYMLGNNFYKVSGAKYKTKWEIYHHLEGSPRKREKQDNYELSFDGELKYVSSEIE